MTDGTGKSEQLTKKLKVMLYSKGELQINFNLLHLSSRQKRESMLEKKRKKEKK